MFSGHGLSFALENLMLCRADLFRSNDSGSFEDGVKVIGSYVGELFDRARRPSDFDGVDASRLCQPEMQTQIVLGEIAAAAANLIGLRHASSGESDARPEPQPIALCPGQFEADPMCAQDAVVVKNHRRAIDVRDDEVDVAIVIQIGNGETTADTRVFDRGPGLLGRLSEGGVAL